MDTQYPSDISNRQWKVLKKVLPQQRQAGRPPLNRRWIVNAILYVLRTGCQWRQLPSDFPNWKSVYTVFWRWRREGLWQQIHGALREQVRLRAGKRRLPT